jgi:hypothetical protein
MTVPVNRVSGNVVTLPMLGSVGGKSSGKSGAIRGFQGISVPYTSVSY